MNRVNCSLEFNPNILVFKRGSSELKRINCALDGTLESKTIRFSNHVRKIFSLFSKHEKLHISFLVDEKKVLIRTRDLDSFNTLESVIDRETIKKKNLEERISTLIDLGFPAPQSSQPKNRALASRKPVRRLPHGTRPSQAIAASSPVKQDALEINPLEKRVTQAFQKYGIQWPLEGSSESLENKVSGLLGDAIADDRSFSTIFQERVVGYQQGGKLLVGQINPKPFSSGSNGDIHAANVTFIDTDTGALQERFAVFKRPKAHIDSSEIRREWNTTLAASKNNPSAIEPLAPVVDASGTKFGGLLLPLFDGNFEDYMKKTFSNKNNQEHLTESVKVFKELALGLSTKHAENIIHNDIKRENIFVELEDPRASTPTLKRAVLGDWSNTMNDGFVVTSIVTFKKEYAFLLKIINKQENGESITAEDVEKFKTIRKRIDVRQLGFFMYETLGASKVRHRIVFPEPYPLKKSSDGNEWPDINKPYQDLPLSVPENLRSLIREMLSPDKKKVPTMSQVADRLKQMNL